MIEKKETILDTTKGGQLVQINMADIKDQVGDQIRAFLMNMMPKEMFDQVIDSAWNNLTKPRIGQKDRWGNKQQDRPSELEEMIMVQMRQELKKRVSAWAQEWGQTPDCELGAKTMLTELVDATAGKFVHRVAAQIVGEAAATLAENASAMMSCSCGSRVMSGQQCAGCGVWN